MVVLFILALGISHSGLRRERLAAERAGRELRRLEETLRHLPVAVQISDASTGTVIFANDEARRLLGADAHVILGRVEGRLRRADGRPVPLEESPVARASRGEAVPLQEFELFTSRTEPLSLLAAAHRVSDERAPLVQTAFLDITERRRLEQFHERAIAIVGHDLRGPLAAIETAARMLDGSAKDVETRRLAERISRSAHHMASMVAELLDFSRARLARGIPIEPRRASLCAIVSDAIEELRPLAGGRIIELDGPETLDGYFDPTRLAQAVGNIVRNAIEHGRSRVSVTIRREDEAGVVRITNDNLAGAIPQHLLPHLFEPFHRGAEPGPGLGLGLYIANEVILGHGGTLEVESTETTTTFTARLPLSGPAALNGRE